MFLQIHTLTGYPASLLVRDEAGLAKRMPFGGAMRTRISSQSLKRHWRLAGGEHALGNVADTSVRSREIFKRLIGQPLVEEGFSPALVTAVLLGFQETLYGKSEKAKAKLKLAREEGKDPLDLLERGELNILGWPEIRYLTEEARKLLAQSADLEQAEERAKQYLKDNKANLHALKNAAGLDVAMFGRMVTGDLEARKDAAVHVAHAFTVHGQEAETDFFTAVDDLTAGTEAGTAHMGDTELTTGLFYGYVVVDVPLLVSNISGVPRNEWRSGNLDTAARLVEHLIHLIATVSPGAKLGSTAPYASADVVLVEAGVRQPRSLAYAFQEKVKNDLGAAAGKMAGYLEGKDAMYGAAETRWLSTIPAVAAHADTMGAEVAPLTETARAVAAAVRSATAKAEAVA